MWTYQLSFTLQIVGFFVLLILLSVLTKQGSPWAFLMLVDKFCPNLCHWDHCGNTLPVLCVACVSSLENKMLNSCGSVLILYMQNASKLYTFTGISVSSSLAQIFSCILLVLRWPVLVHSGKCLGDCESLIYLCKIDQYTLLLWSCEHLC